MKILHIHPSLATGGIESMICGLANEMANRGEDVTVCSIFAPGKNDTFWYKLNNAVKKETCGKLNGGFSFKCIIDIYKIIKKGDYDAVNLHGTFYYYIVAILCLSHRVHFFYTVHSDAYMENTVWDKRLLSLKRLFFKWEWINPITISEASKSSFTKLYGCESTLIKNGIAPIDVDKSMNIVDEVKITEKTKVFIHPARISSEKNQLILCKVFKHLIQEGNDIVLLIAGQCVDKELFESLKAYFSERIKYLGVRDDIPNLMAKANGFCLPSIWEGAPVTLLEALSVGCVPICSPAGGIKNVIHSGENGILSKSSSEEDYYQAMNEYLKMSEMTVSAMKQRCLKSFAPYNISVTAQSYIELYKSKINENFCHHPDF